MRVEVVPFGEGELHGALVSGLEPLMWWGYHKGWRVIIKCLCCGLGALAMVLFGYGFEDFNC